MTTKEYQKKYREDHKEELAAAKVRWLSEHPGYQKQWHTKHPEKRKAYREDWIDKNSLLMRCSRKAAWANGKYPEKITGPEVMELLLRKDRCHWCKEELAIDERTLEHLRPSNDPRFLTVACYSCNSRKLQEAHDEPEQTANWRKRHSARIINWDRKRRGLVPQV